ncbi:MAG: Bax inhibitor-1 family protein [Opitutae bacterium]|nr:Bax inhibitor-1 family protein [Opitutae bacterium]MCD8298561.1 Bax inhibitor-1 family protein [Opitutae bacterium]
MNSYTNPFTVAAAAPYARAAFYRRTYGLVALSCVAFGVVLAALLASPIADVLTSLFFGNGMFGWLIVIAAFWGISAFANRLAFTGASAGTQLSGLGLYAVLEAVIFTPVLNVCLKIFGAEVTVNEIVLPAAAATLLLALGLTLTVFMTRTDFSFLRAFVNIGIFVALGAIVVFWLAGINPGTWLIVALIALMAAAILWYTWIVKERLRPDQHVAAALLIFSGIATMFWYFVQLFISRRQ